jgi:hypothetical protein
MNLINKIQRAMTGQKMLKVEIYDETEVVFVIWEGETPISVWPLSRKIELVTYGDEKNFSAEDLDELSKIMKIISENWEEIDSWLLGWDE